MGKATGCLVAVILSIGAAAEADIVEDVRSLLDEGDYSAALELVQAELKAKPKGNQAGTLNALAGEAAYYMGDRDAAAGYLSKARARGVADAFLLSGRMAMEDYDFSNAAEMYSRYVSMKEKASKPVDPSAGTEMNGASLASEMLDRVEKITVIDRADVEAEDFFCRYNISPESGRLLEISQIADDYPGLDLEGLAQSPVFENERGDFRLWAMADSAGAPLRIVESNRFIGGEWESPVPSDTVLNLGASAAYPFMMADGTTLYFASDGEGSIGGFDIFRSNRDAADASYMAPANMGMPYNSPYNDYMLAIDESKGIGWWATDRNTLGEGKVSIYIFVPNEVRINYDVDTPDLVSFARLDDIVTTQGNLSEDELMALREKESQRETAVRQDHDFEIAISPERTYHSLSDFRSDEARSMMEQYLEDAQAYSAGEERLRQLRRAYGSGNRNVADEILRLERDQEQALTALRKLRGRVIAAERNS